MHIVGRHEHTSISDDPGCDHALVVSDSTFGFFYVGDYSSSVSHNRHELFDVIAEGHHVLGSNSCHLLSDCDDTI